MVMRRLPTLLLILCILFVACGKPRLPRVLNGSAYRVVKPCREFKQALPIPVGERLVYEVRVARFPIYAAVGEVTFEYAGTTAEPKVKDLSAELKTNGESFLHFRAFAVAKGFLVTKILGLEVNDRFEALVKAGDFATRASVKDLDEGRRRVLQTALVDREKLTATYRTTNLNEPQTPAAEKTISVTADAQDLLSAFYFARMQKLKVGDIVRFPLLYDAAQHEFELVVHGREKVETPQGSVKTIKLEPKLFGQGRLIRREGEMTMWVTDDERHTPVKLVSKTAGATITATLKK